MKLMKLLKEAPVDTPGQVMQKAQLAKVRADMKQLTIKQKQLGLSKKNIKDIPSRRRLTKQIADLGSKKAALGIKTADISKNIKKPKTEALIKEESIDPDMRDAVLTIAQNERKFYDKRDAQGAVDFAIKEYIKNKIDDLKTDLESARGELTRALANYWKRQ